MAAIYVRYVPSTKTTVYLDEDSYRRLKLIARQRGCAPALLVREAVVEYAARHATPRLPASLGAAHSGRHDLSERAAELLNGFGADT